MTSQNHIISEKYTDKHGSLAIACDVAESSAEAVFYDLNNTRRFARSVLLGMRCTPENIVETLSRFLITAMREQGVSAADITSVGISAGVRASERIEAELTPAELLLQPRTEICVMPFISARISGRYTSAFLTLPDEDCVFVHFGRELCAAVKKDGKIKCALIPLSGAFDGSGIENGMLHERGSISAVRRESDGTMTYEVVGDCGSSGISPCAAVMTTEIMRELGVVDGDGIMTDRDLFYIGEDYFLSQADVRVIQADKARSAAILSLLPDSDKVFFSGEPFANPDGFGAMCGIGAVPERFKSANLCRDSCVRGIIKCLESETECAKAVQFAQNSLDITEQILPKFDSLYLKFLTF